MEYLNLTHSLDIGQHEYGITDASNRRFVLATHGLGPCTGMAIYNPQTKAAILAHIDAATPDSEVARLAAMLRKDDKTPLEFHLNGGFLSPERRERIEKSIRSLPNITLDKHEGAKLAGLAISALSGEVETDFPLTYLYRAPDSGQRRAKLDQLIKRIIDRNIPEPLYRIDASQYGPSLNPSPRS